MSTTRNYEPKGLRFLDRTSGREMMLVADDDPREELRGWLVYRHPDGQWVTLREATMADRVALGQVVERVKVVEPNTCQHQLEVSPSSQYATCRLCGFVGKWRDGAWRKIDAAIEIAKLEKINENLDAHARSMVQELDAGVERLKRVAKAVCELQDNKLICPCGSQTGAGEDITECAGADPDAWCAACRSLSEALVLPALRPKRGGA